MLTGMRRLLFALLLVAPACDDSPDSGTCEEAYEPSSPEDAGGDDADSSVPEAEELEDSERYCAAVAVMDELCADWRWFAGEGEDDSFVFGCWTAALSESENRYSNRFDDLLLVHVVDGAAVYPPDACT